MKALAGIATALAALGVDGIAGGTEFLFPRRHRRAPRKRLRMARGAGSINAKADLGQLTRANRWEEAANLVDEHYRQCGERLVPEFVVAEWREAGLRGAA